MSAFDPSRTFEFEWRDAIIRQLPLRPHVFRFLIDLGPFVVVFSFFGLTERGLTATLRFDFAGTSGMRELSGQLSQAALVQGRVRSSGSDGCRLPREICFGSEEAKGG